MSVQLFFSCPYRDEKSQTSISSPTEQRSTSRTPEQSNTNETDEKDGPEDLSGSGKKRKKKKKKKKAGECVDDDQEQVSPTTWHSTDRNGSAASGMGVSESKAHAADKDYSSQSQRQCAEWLSVDSDHLTNSGKKTGGEEGKCPTQAYPSIAEAGDARHRPGIKKSSPHGGEVGQSTPTATKSSNEAASSGILSEDHQDEENGNESKKRQDEHPEESSKLQGTDSCQTTKKNKKKKKKKKRAKSGVGMEHPSQVSECASLASQAGNVIGTPLVAPGTHGDGGTLSQEKSNEKAEKKCSQTAKQGLSSVNNYTTDSDQQTERNLASSQEQAETGATNADKAQGMSTENSVDSTPLECGKLLTSCESTTGKEAENIPDGAFEADNRLAGRPGKRNETERCRHYDEELKRFTEDNLREECQEK